MTKDNVKIDDATRLKGKYAQAVGRRKSAIAVVRMYKKGSGMIVVNDRKFSEYSNVAEQTIVKSPLKLTSLDKDSDFAVIVKGGGKKGQAEATKHGITQLLIEMDENLRPSLKAKGYITRDARKKERKKPGLKRARRAPQWSKR